MNFTPRELKGEIKVKTRHSCLGVLCVQVNKAVESQSKEDSNVGIKI